MSDKGTGITITFDSGYFGSIQSISHSGVTREVSDTTTFGTAGGRTFEPSDVYDLGSLSVDILFDPEVTPNVIGGAAEAVSVAYSNANASTWNCTGFMTDFTINAADVDSRVTASATLKLTGNLTVVV